MLNITSYQKNRNQNCNEISPHTVRIAIIKQPTNRSSLVVKQVRDLASSLKWLWSLLWWGSIPGLGTSICHICRGCSPKKTKTKQYINNNNPENNVYHFFPDYKSHSYTHTSYLKVHIGDILLYIFFIFIPVHCICVCVCVCVCVIGCVLSK